MFGHEAGWNYLARSREQISCNIQVVLRAILTATTKKITRADEGLQKRKT